jgi:phosphatidylinositol-3-phosphatase
MGRTMRIGALVVVLVLACACGNATTVPATLIGRTAAPAASTGGTPSAGATAQTSGPSSSRPTTESPGSSGLSRVIVVWLENEEASAVTTSSMPYLYGLSSRYGRATQMYAVAHPSEPNYLAFWSGSTQGIGDDGIHDLDGPSLASQVSAAGKHWRVYAQDVPPDCFAGGSFSGPADGPGVAGTYVRKHEPAISFTSVSGNATACANIQPLGAFDPSAADVAFVVPNLCNDSHDCSLAQGDEFLRAFLPSVFDSPDWSHTLLVVTFDEGSSSRNGGGNVFAMVARQGLSGIESSTLHSHYGVLRTIEDILGLPCLAHACDALPLTEFLP